MQFLIDPPTSSHSHSQFVKTRLAPYSAHLVLCTIHAEHWCGEQFVLLDGRLWVQQYHSSAHNSFTPSRFYAGVGKYTIQIQSHASPHINTSPKHFSSTRKCLKLLLGRPENILAWVVSLSQHRACLYSGAFSANGMSHTFASTTQCVQPLPLKQCASL